MIILLNNNKIFFRGYDFNRENIIIKIKNNDDYSKVFDVVMIVVGVLLIALIIFNMSNKKLDNK